MVLNSTRKQARQSVVVHAFNPSYQEAETSETPETILTIDCYFTIRAVIDLDILVRNVSVGKSPSECGSGSR